MSCSDGGGESQAGADLQTTNARDQLASNAVSWLVASRDRDTVSKFRISFPLVNEQCMHIVT